MSTEEDSAGDAAADRSARRPEHRRSRFGSTASSFGKLVVILGLGAALLFGALFFTNQLSRAPTYGTIWIDSPEVYTRERLVNDRLLQDAWLRARLPGREPGTYAGVQLSSTRMTTDVSYGRTEPARSPAEAMPPTKALPSGAVEAASREKPAPEPPSARQSAGAAATAPPPPAQPPQAPQGAAVSGRDNLAAELDYRDYVRDLLIENQLDDRHDLSGNSLYKLKFDATVIPGSNTQATAQITVKLRPPELTTETWRNIYYRWIESLESRLNAAHRELRLAYDNDRLSYDEYARIFQFVQAVRQANIGAAGTPSACPEAMLRPAEQNLFRRPDPTEQRARKACLQSFVREYVSSKNVGERVGGKYESRLSATKLGSSTVDLETNKLINKFFAAKAVQLVLGISLADSGFVDNDDGYTVDATSPELRKLIELAILDSKFEGSYGQVFSVQPKVVEVAAIGPGIRSEDEYKAVIKNNEDFQLLGWEYGDFVLDQASGLRMDPDSHERLKNAGYEVNPASDLRIQPSSVELMTGSIPLGYFTFRSKAEPLYHTYTYAVTPKERADVINTDFRASSTARATMAEEREAGVSAATSYEGSARALRGFVVGFAGSPPVPAGGKTATKKADANNGAYGQTRSHETFGWVILPRYRAVDGRKAVYIQGVSQYSLSALLSLPSWWSEVTLEITRTWLDPDGTPQDAQAEFVDVQLQPDFDALEASLLIANQLGPVLMESQQDPVLLTACASGAIVIPGRRLWRSSVVTMGSQTADEISVLPNMKGIIAKFREVENQSSDVETSFIERQNKGPRSIARTIRVWTSQGSVALTNRAQIVIPNDCKPTRARS